MTTAHAVAKHIIRFFQEAGDPVTNLKLQKLLYYVQGWHLALLERPAFNDRIEAWVHGPVQPSVYGAYKSYRWNPITEATEQPEIHHDTVDVIEEVLRVYGVETGFQLELRSHSEPPWLQARGGLAPDEESTAIITPDSMRAYFSTLADA